VIATQALASGWTEIVYADAGVPIGTAIAGGQVRFHSIEEIEADAVIISIGDNAVRRQRQQESAKLNHNIATLVVEPGRCFSTRIGRGTVVLAGAIVNDGARIGDGVIVNSGAIVEHDAEVGAFSHVAPGAVLGGGARLGEDSLLGTNATILPRVSVSNRVIIGAGSVVTRDITEPGVYVGAPARLVSPVGH
jgi:UDP-perosamine 4-acetyltransferase